MCRCIRRYINIGQRINSIISTDTVTGRVRRRDFTYSGAQLSIDISQLPPSAWSGLTGIRYVQSGINRCEQNILTVSSIQTGRVLGESLQNTAIYYSDIIETVSGTGIAKPLRTAWHFDLSPVLHTIKVVADTSVCYGNDSMGRFLGEFTLTGEETFDKEWAKDMFSRKPLNCYIEKNYAGRPLLTQRTTYEWNGTAYTPHETEKRS